MDFEKLAPARDYLYLFALLMGAGFGSILNRFRKHCSRSFRNWSITIALILFSGALAALSAAVIYSNGKILMETSLFPYLGILMALFLLSFRFPKAAGFPVIIISGVFIVWLSYGYLRFPPINDSGRLRITRETSGLIHVIPAAAPAKAPEKTLPVFSFQSSGNDQVLEFRAFSFSFLKALPVIGGVNRGDIAEIYSGDEIYYTDPRFGKKLFPGLYLGADAILASKRFFSIEEIPAKLELRRLRSGEGLTVFLSETELTFR